MQVIRLSAYYVALNGQQFLQELTQKMSKAWSSMQNPRAGQFEFLKPTHPHFKYFTSLVEQYTRLQHNPVNQEYQEVEDKIMSLTTEQRVLKYAESRDNILKAGVQLFQWEKYSAEQRQLAHRMRQAGLEPKGEQEAFEDEGIDWHDFVVVQTIDLFEDGVQKTAPPSEEAQGGFQDSRVNRISSEITYQEEYEKNENKRNYEPKVEVLTNQALDPQMVVKRDYERKPIHVQD
mmetsp:Transcript_7863/g.13179  ORF Transcript_7863/g.13179 Transcript_7863/m.13179 type:complete len:233 (+) Transcript_7863:483-1181(+)